MSNVEKFRTLGRGSERINALMIPNVPDVPSKPTPLGMVLCFILIACLSLRTGQAAPTTNDRKRDLLLAAEHGNLPKIKALLAIGENVNVSNINGETALMKAAEQGWGDVTEYLLSHKAGVNARDQRGRTALMRTVWRLSSVDNHSLYIRQVQTIQTLLKHRADVNIKSRDGSTVLMVAALSGNLDLVNVFLARHAEVNARDHNGTTALRCAKRQRRSAVAQRLKQAGGTE